AGASVPADAWGMIQPSAPTRHPVGVDGVETRPVTVEVPVYSKGRATWRSPPPGCRAPRKIPSFPARAFRLGQRLTQSEGTRHTVDRFVAVRRVRDSFTSRLAMGFPLGSRTVMVTR